MSKLIEYKDLIRELAEMLDKSSLSEIEVEEEEFRIRVAREVAPVAAAPAVHVAAPAAPAAVAPAAAPAAAPAEVAAEPAPAGDSVLKSPMVGTAYLSPSPDADAFVAVGSSVKEGDPVLIIEAMKVMNQIVAHKSGKVSQIFVGDAQPVEFDAPLLQID